MDSEKDKMNILNVSGIVSEVTDKDTYIIYKINDTLFTVFKRKDSPLFQVGDSVEITYFENKKGDKTYRNIISGKLVFKDMPSKETEVNLKNQVEEIDLTKYVTPKQEIPPTVKTSQQIILEKEEKTTKTYNLGMAKNGAISLLCQMLALKELSFDSLDKISTKYKEITRILYKANNELSKEI